MLRKIIETSINEANQDKRQAAINICLKLHSLGYLKKEAFDSDDYIKSFFKETEPLGITSMPTGVSIIEE